MNFAVVCVDDRQASGLNSKQVKRAIEYAFDDLCKIGPGVDVVGDLQQRFVYSRLAFFLGVDMCIPVTDGDMLGQIAKEIYFFVVPVIRFAAMMQPHHAEQLEIKRNRNYQNRLAAKAFDQLLKNRSHVGRRGVFDCLRIVEIKAFLQAFKVHAQLHAEQRRQFRVSLRPILVRYAQMVFRSQRYHVASVDAHHFADLGDRRLKKVVEVYDRKGLGADAVENRLARFETYSVINLDHFLQATVTE